MSDTRLREALRNASVPDEEAARDRAWHLVRAAHARRERIWWPRRHGRPLAAALVAVALVASAVTTPGRAVLNSIRDAVGRKEVTTRPAQALTSLPGGGQLLVASRSGLWIVYRGGSRRRLGAYDEASWSPHARYYAATAGNQIFAVEPDGARRVHWALARNGPVRHPRWATDGYRVAYLAGSTLRVVVGDGSDDRAIARARDVAPAWEFLPIHEPVGSRHVLAFVGADGRVEVVDTDTLAHLWSVPAGSEAVKQLGWSGDGARLFVRTLRTIRVFDKVGRHVGAFTANGRTLAAAFAANSHRIALVIEPGRAPAGATDVVLVGDADRLPGSLHRIFTLPGGIADLAWSPSGTWLLVAWQGGDQWQFIRLTRRGRIGAARIVGYANIARQFDSSGGATGFPRLTGWCCAPAR